MRVIQQNWFNDSRDNNYSLARSGNTVAGFSGGYPIVGWLRKPGSGGVAVGRRPEGTLSEGIYDCYYRGSGVPGLPVKWGDALGSPTNHVGQATPSSCSGTKTTGEAQFFEKGYIHGSKYGSYATYGNMAKAYVDQAGGGSGGRLGFPTSDTRVATGSPYGTTGVVQNFEGGHIHESKYGCFATWQPIDAVYTTPSRGGSGGWLGFPISPMQAPGEQNKNRNSAYRRQDFEGGYIAWSQVRGKYAAMPYFLRVQGKKAVYLIDYGRRRWIPDVRTWADIARWRGFDLANAYVKTVSSTDGYPLAKAVDHLLKASNDRKVFYVPRNSVMLRHIPNRTPLDNGWLSWGDVIELSGSLLDYGYQIGRPFPLVQPKISGISCPSVISAGQDITVQWTLSDWPGNVDTEVHYRVDGGSAAHTATQRGGNKTYTATIPANAVGSAARVEIWVRAAEAGKTSSQTDDRLEFFQPDVAAGFAPREVLVNDKSACAPPSSAQIAAINDSTALRIAWQDASDNEDGFQLQRRRWLPAGNWSAWSLLTTAGPNVTQLLDDQLPVGSSYQYRVRAFNSAGGSEWTVSNYVRCEPTPLWPTGLRAELSSDGLAVRLRWTDKSDYENCQKIERRRQLDATTWTDWTTIVWLGANVTTHTDRDLQAQGLHQYRVRALRGPGASEYSPVAQVFVRAASPVPKAPSDAQIVAVNDSRDMRITWRDNSINESGFRLERRRWLPEGKWSAWSLLTTTGPNAMQFVDTLLPVGSSYQYRVRAFSDAGASGWAEANATRCEPTPIWPVNLRAENRNFGRDLMLSWTNRSQRADRQKIERRRQLGRAGVWSEWKTIVWLGANRTSYLDDSIPGDGKYQYRVRQFRGLGASEYSPVLTAWRLKQAQPAALISSMSVQQVGGQAVSAVYSLSANADVTLEVRNIAGRLISTVPQGTVEAGVNTAIWNLRNSAGAPVPSGMYLCTLVVHGADGSRSSAVRTVNIQR